MLLGDRRWQQKVDANETVNRIFESFAQRRVAMPGAEIIVKNVMHVKDSRYNLYPNLDFVPAQFELDDTEIDLASTSYSNPSLSDWEKRTLLCEWLDRSMPPRITTMCCSTAHRPRKSLVRMRLHLSNCFIIPVIPDEFSSRGVTHFQGLVQRKIDEKLKHLRTAAKVGANETPANYVKTTEMAAIVPFLVKQAGRAASGLTNIHTEQLGALRRQWGKALLKTVGKNYIGIPEAVNAGWPVWNYWGQNAKIPVQTMMTNICQELKTRIDAS